MVEVRRYAVTTHDRWLSPWRSPAMVGNAVDTIVWSSAARNMPSMSAPSTTTIRRCSSSVGVSAKSGRSVEDVAETSVDTRIFEVALERGGEPVEQGGKRRKVGFVPVRHQTLVPLAPCVQDPFDRPPPRTRQQDAAGPPVIGVGTARDELLALELLDLPGDGWRVHPEQIGQR